MKKSIKYIILLICVFFIPCVFAIDNLNFCDQEGIIKAMKLIGTLFNILKILIPVILILSAIILFFKAYLSGDDKATNDALRKLFSKFIAGLLIFLIPTILRAVLLSLYSGADSFVSDGTKTGGKTQYCYYCFLNPSKC